MIVRNLTFAVLATCVLGACTGTPEPSKQQPPKPQATRVKTPLDTLMKDRDRAKAVQGKVDAQAKRQREAIDAQTD